MPHASPLPTRDRIVTIDAVRGFALFGIIAVHMVEQYLGSPPPASRTGVEMSAIDGVALGLVGLLFVGKFFAMFSLLFGVSFFIQMDRAAARGQAFGWRFAWRLAVLFAIGMVHQLIYLGDILSIYAALGFVLLFFYRVSDRWLLATGVAVLLGAPRLLQAAWTAATGAEPSLTVDDAVLQAHWDSLKAGSPAAIAWLNLTEGIWPKLDFLFGWFGRGYQTLGLFLVGLYLGRHRWHEQLDSRRAAVKRLAWWSLGVALAVPVVVGAIGGLLYAAGQLPDMSAPAAPGEAPAVPLWLLVGGFMFYDVFNLAVMGAFLGGFLLLFFRPGPQRVLRLLAPVGQTALTVYVAQSVIGGLIYFGYGLNLLGEIGPAAGLGLAVVLFSAQVLVANLWLQVFRFGPLEWFWRSATYLRIQPFVRRAQGAPPVPEPA